MSCAIEIDLDPQKWSDFLPLNQPRSIEPPSPGVLLRVSPGGAFAEAQVGPVCSHWASLEGRDFRWDLLSESISHPESTPG